MTLLFFGRYWGMARYLCQSRLLHDLQVDVLKRKMRKESKMAIHGEEYWMFRKEKGCKGPKNPSMEFETGCPRPKKRGKVQDVQLESLILDVQERRKVKKSKTFSYRACN